MEILKSGLVKRTIVSEFGSDINVSTPIDRELVLFSAPNKASAALQVAYGSKLVLIPLTINEVRELWLSAKDVCEEYWRNV